MAKTASPEIGARWHFTAPAIGESAEFLSCYSPRANSTGVQYIVRHEGESERRVFGDSVVCKDLHAQERRIPHVIGSAARCRLQFRETRPEATLLRSMGFRGKIKTRCFRKVETYYRQVSSPLFFSTQGGAIAGTSTKSWRVRMPGTPSPLRRC